MNGRRIGVGLAIVAALAIGYAFGAGNNGRYIFERGEDHTLYVFDTRTGTINVRSILGLGVHRFEPRQPPGTEIKLTLPEKETPPQG